MINKANNPSKHFKTNIYVLISDILCKFNTSDPMLSLEIK